MDKKSVTNHGRGRKSAYRSFVDAEQRLFRLLAQAQLGLVFQNFVVGAPEAVLKAMGWKEAKGRQRVTPEKPARNQSRSTEGRAARSLTGASYTRATTKSGAGTSNLASFTAWLATASAEPLYPSAAQVSGRWSVPSGTACAAKSRSKRVKEANPERSAPTPRLHL